ncbi:nucleotidyltransferase family protein [Robiginitalea aurantiaca]|uniref:Sugar phosphate nucleotidyltransferase n=1 Tax=Robiginitalea aurantiaca TaxID=3056915 RepID=A0ABT7WBN7_9FLAO|nr:sugar phosphate nucleotidyltransferase [Robiginitalea aurantiaca]MDM9630323.1 sugar phosphate nucleotidyltransferase [Robiginitalea aurantiaca]
MTLLLMAAGRGSRYGKLKQFDDMGPNGEFLMEFSIHDAITNGFEHIVVITQKDNVDYLREYLSERLPSGVSLDVLAQELTDLPAGSQFAGERPKPWGTAHAVWTARNVISNPFAVINADDYYGQAAYSHAADFIKKTDSDEAFGIVAYTLKDTLSPYGSVSRGVCSQEGKSLLSVDERLEIAESDGQIKDSDSGLNFSGEELVSMNFWVCQPSIFPKIEADFKAFLNTLEDPAKGEIYLPFVIQDMLRTGSAQVEVIPSESKWFGITYAADKEKAMAELARLSSAGKYPAPLWKNT